MPDSTEELDRAWDDLYERLENKDSRETRFAPVGVVEKVLTRDRLTRLFKERLKSLDVDLADLEEIASTFAHETISREGRSRHKIVAISIWCGSAVLDEVMRWYRGDLARLPTDDDLPLHAHQLEQVFNDQNATKFGDSQAVFLPIVYNRDSEVVIPSEDAKYWRHPIIGNKEMLGHGYSASVVAIMIAGGHLRRRDGTTNSHKLRLVCKTFIDPEIWTNEKEIMARLERPPLKHSNLTTSRGSVVVRDGNTDVQCMLLYDAAICDLQAAISDVNQNGILPRSTPQEKADILSQFCNLVDGVAQFHNCGLLHLNIKPTNILLFKDEHGKLIWKLADYGFSKKNESGDYWNEDSSTNGTRYLGTYQAPEVGTPSVSRVGWWSDCWSLGCILILVLIYIDGGCAEIKEFGELRQQSWKGEHGVSYDTFYALSVGKIKLSSAITQCFQKLRSNASRTHFAGETAVVDALNYLEHELLVEPINRRQLKDGRMGFRNEMRTIMNKYQRLVFGHSNSSPFGGIRTDETQSTRARSIFDDATQSHNTEVTPFSIDYIGELASSPNDKVPSYEAELEQMLENKERQDNDTYSEAGSIADHEEVYSGVLRNELLQDLNSIDLTNMESLLCVLLEEFAIRIGHEAANQDYQNMMYVAHKKRRKIAKLACEQPGAKDDGTSLDESNESERAALMEEYMMFYSDKHNIENWNMSSQSGVMASNPTDVDMNSQARIQIDSQEDRLKLGLEALRESYAYKWLISAVQRNGKMDGARHDCMKDHRRWLLTILESNTLQQALRYQKISRNRRPILYSVKFQLNWNLTTFLLQQEYASESLHEVISKVITLSGDDQFVQALPCKEYMQQIWPSTSADIVWLLERLVENPAHTHECILSDKTEISARCQEDIILIEVTGTKYGLAEVTEQLLWVATALQTPADTSGPSFCLARLIGEFVVDESIRGNSKAPVSQLQHVGTAHCKVTFENIPRVELVQSVEGDCWHNLFHHSVIVYGYPVPTRASRRPGLEIPFDMMAALIGAERITPFCGHLMVKGLSTLLYPTCYEDEVLYWHLVHNEDGSRISFADTRVPLSAETDSVLTHIQPNDVHGARHVVGWSPVLKKNTGTFNANYDIKWSGLSNPSGGYALEKVQISGGKYITVGGTFARGTRDKAVHVKDQGDYMDRLISISNKFVVLHDIEVRKAWLVDGLSALLHLVRAYLVYFHDHEDYGMFHLANPEDLKERGGDGDGGINMALQTLIDPTNMNIRIYKKDNVTFRDGQAEEDDDFYCLVDAIKYILHLLEQISDHQADERAESSVGYRIRTSPCTQLEGFDFMDLATKSNLVWPRATTLGPDGRAWAGLTRAVHTITLFGRGFGSLLEPAQGIEGLSHCLKCSWNADFPSERDILAVPMSAIERIVERRGSKIGTCWRLVDEYYLDFPPELFSPCTRNKRQGYCQQRIRPVLNSLIHSKKPGGQDKPKSISKFVSKWVHRNDNTRLAEHAAECLNFSAGGVLLGTINKRLQKDAPKKLAEKAIRMQETGLPSRVSPQATPASSSSPLYADGSNTTARVNSESTSLTEPSRLEGPQSH